LGVYINFILKDGSVEKLSKKVLTISVLALGVSANSLASGLDRVDVVTDFSEGVGYSFQLPMNCGLLAGNNNSCLIIAG
jgi:hypothetical protein